MRDAFAPLAPSKKLFNWSMGTLGFFLSVVALIPLIAIFWSIVSNGLPHLSLDTLTQLPAPAGLTDVPNGFANAIIGTVAMVAIAAMISLPLGILTAIYLSEFGKQSAFASWVRFMVTILSAAPSIVIGVFAYAVIVLPFQSFSAIAGGFALSILMLPLVALATEESLKSVPNSQRMASAALGAGYARTTLRIVIARALPGIITSGLLAIARASGETAPLIFTALFSQGWLESFFGPSASLSVLIYNYASSPFSEQNDLAWAAALMLLIIVLITNLLSRWVASKR